MFLFSVEEKQFYSPMFLFLLELGNYFSSRNGAGRPAQGLGAPRDGWGQGASQRKKCSSSCLVYTTIILIPVYFSFRCSPWDMGRFFSAQCRLCSIPVPKFARKWINLRKLYRNFYKTQKGTLEDMVNNLGMRFEGRPHSGMDDSRNITRILQKMAQDGCEVKFNEYLYNNTP